MNNQAEPQDVKRLLQQDADYFSAPADLRQQLIRDVSSPPLPSKWQTWLNTPWLRLGSGFVSGALIASIATSFWIGGAAEEQATLLALASDHARAIVTQNTMEVRSSSMHTVKPWLSSTLGYSPEVVDLMEQGFPLMGGRRGYLGSEPVAVIVYGHKQHEIDVYALRSGITLPRHPVSANGFHALSWEVGDMRYLAISDVEKSKLKEFSVLLQQRQSASF
jgi:anti-sigma factor RsiW